MGAAATLMAETENKLPDFRKPPVVEVVCGVLFSDINALKAAHLGDFWNPVRQDFPKTEERQLLSAVVEVFGQIPQPTFQVSNVPPLSRVWFFSEREDKLIQIQRDRFLFNWRRLNADDEYPRFESVYGDFVKYLGKFRDFVQGIDGGVLAPLQYELTYVNRVDGSLIDNEASKLGRVFRDCAWSPDSNRWLPLPCDSTWRASFELPDQSGRLHTVVRLLAEEKTQPRSIRFELTARGIGTDRTLEGMKRWFKTAHEWVVRGFADLTNSDIQHEVWERIDV